MRKLLKSSPPATPAAEAAPSTGAILRDARFAMGAQLVDVAAALRIRLVYLQAIEDGRYHDLPGVAYGTGFVRSYAEYCGLVPEQMVRRFKDEVAGQEPRHELYFPTPAQEGRVPGGTLLFIAIILAAAIYGGWYYMSATDRRIVDVVPALPGRLVALLEGLPWRPMSPDEPALPGDDLPTGASAALHGDKDGPAALTSLIPPPPPLPAHPPAAATQTVPAPVAAPAGTATGNGKPGASSPPAPGAPPPVATPATKPVGNGASPAPPTAAASTPATPTPTAPAPTAAPAAQTQPAGRVAANTPPSPAQAAALAAASGITTLEQSEEEAEGSVQEPTPLTPNSSTLNAPAASDMAGSPADIATPTGKVYGVAGNVSRFQLRATQETWVQVKDSSGEVLFNRTMKAGEMYRAPDRPGLRLRVGNAGGLVVITDGIAGPPLGAVGQVLRDVQLDSPALRPGNG